MLKALADDYDASAGLVRSRMALINTARGLSKSYERLRDCFQTTCDTHVT